MSDNKIQQFITNLQAALYRLQEALDEPMTNSLVIDGTIQRFEFVTELFWKTLRRALEEEGIQTLSPHDALQKAYKWGWLESGEAWFAILKTRNQTTQLYDEEMAKKIYQEIKTYFPELQKTFLFIQQRFQENDSF